MERRLSAILAADMVGYSRLMEADEVGTLARQKELRNKLIDPRVKRFHGRVFKEIGDGLLIEFPSVVEAVQCAVEVQTAIHNHQFKETPDRRIQYRVGINLGDVVVEDGDLFGDGVNVAARLEQLADPGGVCISGTVFDHLKSQVSKTFEPMGDVKVKNMEVPVRAYRMVADGLSAKNSNKHYLPVFESRNARLLASGFLVLALATVAIWWLINPKSPVNPGVDRPSIAVLPFENLSGSPDQEYLSDGLADDLISDLSKISGIQVVGRSSSFSFKGITRDPVKISRELGARYILDGSIRHAGGSLRVNTRLVEGESDQLIWAERFDRAYEGIFRVQNDIIKGVAGALSLQLTNAEETEISRLPTDNLEAYDFFLRAQQSSYYGEENSVSDALDLYQRAFTLDPQFASAFAGYARVATDILLYGYFDRLPAAVARKRAYETSSKAIQLDPTLAGGYSVLSLLQMFDGAYESAFQSAHSALSLASNKSESHLNYAIVLIYAGRHQEALDQFEIVAKLDPKIPGHLYDFKALALYLEAEYEQALLTLEAFPSKRPSDIRLEILAGANARLKRQNQAEKAVAEILKRLPESSVEGYRFLYAHHANENDIEKRLESLSLAGLPTWPMNFEGEEKDKLSGNEFSSLIKNKTWQGERVSVGPFIRHFDSAGNFVERGRDYQFTGKASVKNDQLCSQSSAILLNRPTCGPIYRNTKSADSEKESFSYPSGFSLYRFSAK